MSKLKKSIFDQSILHEIRNLFIFSFLSIIVILFANYSPLNNDLIKIITLVIISLIMIYATLLFLAIAIKIIWDFLN